MSFVAFYALIAALYLGSLIPAILSRNWPGVLISLGCALVLIGNIWEFSKHV